MKGEKIRLELALCALAAAAVIVACACLVMAIMLMKKLRRIEDQIMNSGAACEQEIKNIKTKMEAEAQKQRHMLSEGLSALNESVARSVISVNKPDNDR